MREPRREDPAESFGPYLIYEALGRGGMATVHRAKQTGIEGFERPVALKRMLPWLTSDPEFVKSFVREARLAAQLRHTNIVQTYDLGKVDGTYYIAMELVSGRDVRELLRHAHNVVGPPPAPVTIHLLHQVCDALDYAHSFRDEQGRPLELVHRDISPANVLLAEDGNVKIVDFGVAKGSTATLATMSGMLKGKFAYMAPEMIQGQIDGRCDLFAVGVVAWELLTARPLFAGGDDMEILQRVTTWEPPAPSTINPGVPRELDAWVAMALAKQPQRRFQSAAQMRAGLELVARTPSLRASNSDVAAWVGWAFAQQQGQPLSPPPAVPAAVAPLAMPPAVAVQPLVPAPLGTPHAMAAARPAGTPHAMEAASADSVSITIEHATNVRPQPAASRAADQTQPGHPGPRSAPVTRQPPARAPAGMHATMIGTAVPAAVAAAAAAAAAQQRGSATAPPSPISTGTVPPSAAQATAAARTVMFEGAPPAPAPRPTPGHLPAMPPGATEAAAAPAYQAAGHHPYQPQAHGGQPAHPPPPAVHAPGWAAGTPGGAAQAQAPHTGGPIGGFVHAPGAQAGPGWGPAPSPPTPAARGKGLLIAVIVVLCAGAAAGGYFLIQHLG